MYMFYPAGKKWQKSYLINQVYQLRSVSDLINNHVFCPTLNKNNALLSIITYYSIFICTTLKIGGESLISIL